MAGNGLCGFPFEIENDLTDEPLDNAALGAATLADGSTPIDLLCTDIALQRTFWDFRVCRFDRGFTPANPGTFIAGQSHCDCAQWFDFTTTDAELFPEADVDGKVNVDCSERFAFDGRASADVRELIFPDGCANDSFVYYNGSDPQRIVIEGAIEREIIVDIDELEYPADASKVLVEVVNPYYNNSNPPPLRIMYADFPAYGEFNGEYAIRTRTVPDLDDPDVETFIVSVCTWIGCNRPRLILDQFDQYDTPAAPEFCVDFYGPPDIVGDPNAWGWEHNDDAWLYGGNDTYLGGH